MPYLEQFTESTQVLAVLSIILFAGFIVCFPVTWEFVLILGAIATATAPASTMMTINQYKAKGEFVNTLLQIVALDDVVCLFTFSIVAAIASAKSSGSVSMGDVLLPVAYNFTPPILSLFFILSGMKLDVAALGTVGLIGICYFIIQIVGKYLGTFISCSIMKTSREIRNYLGLALVPQAGVAIGLAFLGQRMLPAETGSRKHFLPAIEGERAEGF